MSVTAKLRRISEETGLEVNDLRSPVFNSVEVAAKLYELDPIAGLTALRQLQKDILSLEEVRSRYEDAATRATVAGTSSSEKDIQILKNAKTAKVSWHVVASAILRLESSVMLDGNGLTWMERAESETGWPVVRLRRMTTTLSTLNEMAVKDRRLPAVLRTRSFSTLEMIARIGRIDSAKATDLALGDGNLPDLQDVYDDMRQAGDNGLHPGTLGTKLNNEYRVKVMDLIQASPGNPLIPDAGSVQFKRNVGRERSRESKYANPDYIVEFIEEGAVVSVDAIDCRSLRTETDVRNLRRRMPQIATECTFFSRFWLVVPPGEAADGILEICNELDLGNVGIVLSDGTNIDWRLIPTSGPVPDRRKLWGAQEVDRDQPETSDDELSPDSPKFGP